LCAVRVIISPACGSIHTFRASNRRHRGRALSSTGRAARTGRETTPNLSAITPIRTGMTRLSVRRKAECVPAGPSAGIARPHARRTRHRRTGHPSTPATRSNPPSITAATSSPARVVRHWRLSAGRIGPGLIGVKCAKLKLWWKTRHARAAYRRLFDNVSPRKPPL
jgi:hypothetical protein